ncbi:alpha-1,4-N-acetylglucosaminyltransferase-like [Penaeus monodon]|uniref:alpha-1,4-N-acetylglucosaminyltransferase-like n=1 Tax=Penaeus monodon TaxID=6687 RepID=UPI0018A775DE|nr:alpha-1,4-N-acetylglucosaminyltransferase-like [Penaeus monodon]
MDDPESPCSARTKNGFRVLKAALVVSAAFMVTLFSLSGRYYGNYLTTIMPEEVSYPAWVEHLCPRYYYGIRRSTAGLLKLSWKPLTDDAIFFIQTSCARSLGSRQACVVESAAHHHPHQPIRLLMTAPYINHTHPLLQVLLGLRNVQMHWLDLDQVFVEEPLLSWHRDRYWYMNQVFLDIAPATVSDAVRSELLRRMGGVFLDLDVITLRPLPARANWVGRLDHNQVSTAVANFTKNHRLLQMVVDAIPKAHDPRHCCTIGPALVTSYLHQLCPDNVTIPDATDPQTMESCDDIKIFNTHAFFPLSYVKEDILRLFKTREGIGPQFLASTRAYTLHLYHSLTKSGRLITSSDSILEEAARRNCPKVYKTIIENNLLL